MPVKTLAGKLLSRRNQTTRPALIVLDLDQCVVWTGHDAPFAYYQSLPKLSRLVMRSREGKLPPICINTGRDRNYVEAVTFLTGISDWCVIEGGARLFHPVTKEIENNPEITLEAFKALMKLQQEWVPEICKRFPELVPYPGKTAYVTLEVHPHTARMPLEEYYKAVKEDLQGMEQEGLIVIQRSQIAIDIGAAGKEGPINKGSGMRLLAQKMGVHPRQMLALGDAMSDYSMIQEAGFAACPSNATEEFQRMTLEQGGFVSSRPYVEGVVDAIRHFCRG